MHQHATSYAVHAPYPPIDQVVPNQQDLRLTYDLYSGVISEYSAISQYVYHHLYAQNANLDPVSQTLLGIAMVEMRHLNILGGLVYKLGGEPQFLTPVGQDYQPWCATSVDYGAYLKEMLTLDIESEEAAICAYAHGAKATAQSQVATLFRRIVEDEQLHLKAFRALKAQL